MMINIIVILCILLFICELYIIRDEYDRTASLLGMSIVLCLIALLILHNFL